MRSSSRGQKSIRKSAAKPRASLAPVPPDLTVNSRVLVKAVEGEEPLPGTILFIGPTQFAEGTWLGVELDEPKGKNSGKVQDVTYFMAGPNHGLFVRAGKVQKIQEEVQQDKQPLESEASASYFIVGARVLVRPAENSAGAIRFVGSTEFADGEWFGVELEKPLGKNDGTVKGVSYFSCPAMHGIFARREHLLEAPSPSTSTASPSADTSPAKSSNLLSPPSTSPTATPKEEIGDAEFPAVSIRVDQAQLAVVEEMKAEVERLRKELQQYKALEDSSPQPAAPSSPSRITKKMKETFENEIDHFLERRSPLWPRALSGPTGFGLFLRERALQNENAFHDIAITASQLWGQLDEDAKKGFRERHQAMVRLRSKNQKLQVAKNEHWKLESPGVSRHSEGYLCTVKEVRQIGADSIELDFVAEGDGSKGALQKPEDSEITWEGKKKTARPEKPLRLKLNENGGSSGPSKIEGTMVFKKVPTSGTAVTFAFGKSGYRRLLLHFPSSTANSAIALPFASAVYGRRSLMFEEDSESEYEDDGVDGDSSQPLEKTAKPKVLKGEELEALSSLIKGYWHGEEPQGDMSKSDEGTAPAPVFKFELDESVLKVEKCLLGDLHLMSPETQKVGRLSSTIKRFDLVAMKTQEKSLHGETFVLTSLNLETFVCKVVSERASFRDPIDKEPSRIGHVTLSNLRFMRRPADSDITSHLISGDFFPPEVGDLHRQNGKPVPVTEVWEDELTGRFHWSYGQPTLDQKAFSTCCTRKGRLVAPFRALPVPAIREMVQEETRKDTIVKRVWPDGWCDIPSLWSVLDAGHNSLEVACVSAVVHEMVSLTTKRRGGPRAALAVDAAKVNVRRPKVKVKCIDKAFKCKAGSRFGILKQNALGKDCIDRCGCTIAFSEATCMYRVKIDNSSVEVDMDARMGQAIQLPSLEYPGGTSLTILLEDGRLVNAKVSRREKWNTFALRFPDGEGEKEQLLELNEANHVYGSHAELDVKAYDSYCTTQRDRFRYLEDSITCQKMDVETQVIYIDTAVENATRSTPDIKSLASLLLDADGERLEGQQLIFRCLMIAGPGTGKTWSSCQLMYHLSKACAQNTDSTGIVKMPALIFAQKLAGMMRKDGISDAKYASLPLTAQNAILDKPWLQNAFKGEYGTEYADILDRALQLRSAVVILDGIDEASDVKGVLQSYIMRRLVPMEISLVLTSRPEGVSADLSTLKQKFAIMTLKPLSDEQQKQIILNQVKSEGNQFFEKLMKFAEIRATHDKIYFNEAFDNPKDRRYMEKQLHAVNRFKKRERPGEAEVFDPTMVQHTLEGKVIEATSIGAEPTSEYLKGANTYFTDGLLSMMDKMLAETKTTAELGDVLKDQFPGIEAFKSGPSLALKLYELAEKRKEQHAELWSKVMSGTDQLLTVAEHFKPLFEKTVEALCKDVTEELEKTMKDASQDLSYDLVIGPLKDPVRVTEKAADDYATRFVDLIAECNVVDVIRARLVCSSGTQMKDFLKKIAEDYETEIDGQKVKLTLARVKNKFSSKDSDPSRFRNVLLNLQLHSNAVTENGQTKYKNFHFVELQVHHKLILKFNDDSHAHDFYDFFRRELASQYGKEMEASLNFMLEERMQLFKEISEVPVLLSVMTMALMHSNRMPSSLYELYDMGLQNILESQLGQVEQDVKQQLWQLMQLVALHNQLNQKRIFMQKDVESALAKEPELLPTWTRLVQKGDVPFVKILADGEDAEYQFRHLSFQEALASQVLAESNGKMGVQAANRFKEIGGSLADFLNMPFYRNMLRIGAGFVGDVFGTYWPLTSQLTDNGRTGLWNLLLGAKKLILVSFLRPQVDGHRAYEKAGFPERSEDWFYTMFLYKSTIELKKGSVMYSLRNVKSQVKNLEAALVSNAACHLLFRSNNLDLSAFEVKSDSFPVHWNGAGRALDLSKTPGRIGLQLSMNSKNSLVHYQESEVSSLDSPLPKMEIADRVSELHGDSGTRWIFVSDMPQEPFSFDPSLCTKVLPVYIRNSGNPKLVKAGNVHQWQQDLSEARVPTTSYQRAYELGTLSGMKDLRAAPTAGKRRAREQGPILARRRLQEEYWRFYRTDDLILEAESYDVRAFCGGELVRHYRRVDKVARSSRRRQFLAQGFLCMQAAFRIWKMARGIPEPEPSKEVETDDANASKRLAESEDPDSSEQIKEVAGEALATLRGAPPSAKEEEQTRRETSEVKFCHDTGGNAKEFRACDAQEGLVHLKNLWSKAWKEQGQRLSDFQRFLTEMPVPVLGASRLRNLRPWLRQGQRWDFRLESWPVVEIGVISPVLRRKAKVESEGKPKKADNEDEEDAEAAATAAELVATKAAEAAKAITAASNRINSRVVTEWTSALRGHAKTTGCKHKASWDPQFISSTWTVIPERVIRNDLILPHQAPALGCEKGHALKLAQNCRGTTCDRCDFKATHEEGGADFFGCRTCDFDLCTTCWTELKKDFWRAASQDTWSSDRRHKAMKAVCRAATRRKGEKLDKVCLRIPGHKKHTQDREAGDASACDACSKVPEAYFVGFETWKRTGNPETLKLCQRCYTKRKRKVDLKLRKPWDEETATTGWPLLPIDAVLLDHPTKMQLRIAKRRRKGGKTWQQCLKAFSERKPSLSFNIEFFTHRMEPEKAARFATEFVDLFIVTAPEKAKEETNLWRKARDEAFPRCLVAHLRRCKKRLEAHPRSGLKGVLPSAFFSHRMDEGDTTTAFLKKFARILRDPKVHEPAAPEPGGS